MTDIRWLEDMDPFGLETESAEEELQQDAMHVLEEDLGTNLDDLTRGLGLANSVSKPLPSGLEKDAETQLLQDDRISSATARISVDDANLAEPKATMDVTINENDTILQAIDLQVPIGTGTG